MKRLLVALAALLFSVSAQAQTEPFGTYVGGLPSAGSISGIDKMYVLQGGVSKSVSPSLILTTPGGSSGNIQFNNGGIFGGLTDVQVTSRIQLFSNSLSGAVPGSGGGTTNFLRADGTWAVPTGGGAGNPAAPTNAIQFNSAGAFGGSANLTWDGTNVIIGNNASVDNNRLQVVGLSTSVAASISQIAFNNSNNNATMQLKFSRGVTVGSQVITQNGDWLGSYEFLGSDGVAFKYGAALYAQVDAVPAANSMPTRLLFGTTPTGSTSYTERMRIASTGNIGIGSTTPNLASWNSNSRVLTIAGPGTVSTSRGILELANNSTDLNGLLVGVVDFIQTAQSGLEVGQISVTVDGATAGNRGGFMSFNTKSNGSGGTNEAMRIDRSQSVITGDQVAQGFTQIDAGNPGAWLQIASSTNKDFAWNSITVGNQSNSLEYASAKTRGATPGVFTTTVSGDALMRWRMYGTDGTSYVQAATFASTIDGAVATNIVPGRWAWSTMDTAGSLVERMRIDNSGRVTTSVAAANTAPQFIDTFNDLAGLQVFTKGGINFGIHSYGYNHAPGQIELSNTRGTTIGTLTALLSTDQLGVVDFAGADGTNLINTAQIQANVDGAVGTGSIPSRLGFFTSPASAGDYGYKEAMRIDSTQSAIGVFQTIGTNTVAASWNVINSSNSGTGATGTLNLENSFKGLSATATVTITNASPAVFTITGHGYVPGQVLQFTTTGTLPTGLSLATNYYVIATGLTANAFEVSLTPGGTAVNTSSAGSGTHTSNPQTNVLNPPTPVVQIGPNGLTGALTTAAVSITQTWNTTGAVDAGLLINVTNVASPANSALLDAQVGGTSQFAFLNSADYTGVGGVAIANPVFQLGGGGTNGVFLTPSSGALWIGRAGFGNSVAIGYTSGGSFGPGVITLANGGYAFTNSTALTNGLVSGNDVIMRRDAAGVLALNVGVSAQGFRVYNTADAATAPTNYERGVFDWQTTTNVLTIGTQAGGTGTVRTLALIVGTTATQLTLSTTGQASLFGSNVAYTFAGADTGMYNPASTVVAFKSAGNWIGDFDFNHGAKVPLGQPFAWAAGPANGPDTGWSRIAATVIAAGNGSSADVSGYIQWGGQKRVTSDVTFTSTTTLATVTGLSANVAAGRTYSFVAELSWTDAAAGGLQLAISGTATATNIIYDGYIIDSAANGIKGNAQATALGTAVASSTTTGTAGHAKVSGTITVNAAGTLLVQAAQNTSNGTATTIKRGSYFIVQDMP